MPLPFVDLKQQYQRLKPLIDERIHRVLDHGQYILGPEVRELEEALAAFTGARHAIAVSSGTDALLIALMAEGVGPGDAVFVPAFTYTATAEVILLLGAVPVFVDVDPRSFNIDLDDLGRRIAETRAARRARPRAVIAVDLFGQPADYPGLRAIAEAEDLFLIGDAAQSLGASLDGRRAGALAPVTATSFYPAKPLGCYGDGGALFTDDDALAETMRSIRVHGEGKVRYETVRVGVNGRMDTLQAAILLAKLPSFAAELDARDALARHYAERLADRTETPALAAGAFSAWAQYTVQLDRRDEVKAALAAAGIPSVVYYPQPMHLQAAYRSHGGGQGSMPVSERLCGRVLSLPMHPFLAPPDAERICDVILTAA